MVALVGTRIIPLKNQFSGLPVKYPSMIRDHARSSESFEQNGPREEGPCLSGTIVL